MSHANSTRISGESALVGVLEPPQYTSFDDPNSFAAINEDCYGLLAPLIVSGIPGIAMWLATGIACYQGAPEHLPDIARRTIAVLLFLAVFPSAFLTYRITVQFGCLCSGATFLVVAIFLPMSAEMQVCFCLGVLASFIAAAWADEFGEQP